MSRLSEGHVKGCDSALLPVEELKQFPVRGSNSIECRPEEALRSDGFVVAAYDSSTYYPSPHFGLNIAIVSVGFWCQDYAMASVYSDMYPRLFTSLPRRRREVIAKIGEAEALDVLMERLSIDEGGRKIMLLDEALNLSYTLALSQELRREVVSLMKEILNKVIRAGFAPAGVFYTRAQDLANSLRILGVLSESDGVTDKSVMNWWLNPMARSPVFKVYSRPLLEGNLSIMCFYLKVGEGNVLRVEFPEECLDQVNDIHLAALCQSFLGNGYPLALERAHELAVLTREDRQVIEMEIARLLGVASLEELISRKEVAKRWPVV